MTALDDFGLMLVDDHPLFRDALAMALQVRAPGLRVKAVSSAEEARQCLDSDQETFDLVLLDYRLPGVDGLRCAQQLQRQYAHVGFGLMSGLDDASLPLRVREAGLVAYLPKALEIDALLEALYSLAMGETVFHMADASAGGGHRMNDFGLTARQAAVLRLLATGASNKEIAQSLGISPATVKNHLDAIFEKMGASNRLQAAMMAKAATSDPD